jgi:hypothetical protein
MEASVSPAVFSARTTRSHSRTCVPARAPLVADPAGRPRAAIATRKLAAL